MVLLDLGALSVSSKLGVNSEPSVRKQDLKWLTELRPVEIKWGIAEVGRRYRNIPETCYEN